MSVYGGIGAQILRPSWSDGLRMTPLLFPLYEAANHLFGC